MSRTPEQERDWLLRMAEAEKECGGVMACNPDVLAAWKDENPLMYAYAMGQLFQKPTEHK